MWSLILTHHSHESVCWTDTHKSNLAVPAFDSTRAFQKTNKKQQKNSAMKKNNEKLSKISWNKNKHDTQR